MSDSQQGKQRVRPLQLMLVGADPVFRLGLKVWLEQRGEFAVAAEAGNAADAVATVRDRLTTYQQSLDDPALRKKTPLEPPLDLVILDLGIGANDPTNTPGLALCQQLKTEFPQLPVVVLGMQNEPVLQAAAARMGASGYGTRSMPVRKLAQLIRQAVSGATLPADGMAQAEGLEIGDGDRWSDSGRAAAVTRLDDIPGPFTAMRISMRLSGLRNIDRSLSEVNRARAMTNSWLNRAVLNGKKRELVAARWLVSLLWRTPRFRDQPGLDYAQPAIGRRSPASLAWMRTAQRQGSYADMTAARYLDPQTLVPNANATLSALESRIDGQLEHRTGDVQAMVFEGVFAKLQRPLKNISAQPLEIDILRPEKKLELLYLVLRQLEDLLADLRTSQVQTGRLQPGQLTARSLQVIRDLWETVNTEFFGKYYTVRVGNVEEEVVTLLQQEKLAVQTQILDRIPMVSELFGHWLFQEPMVIDSESYIATAPAAIAYSEALLENLVIQVANAVVQPLLNRLADTESIKKSLYTARLMSSREIERFRNDLSWRYRWDRLINEPKAIFESRYILFVLTPNGIDTSAVYAPRRAELERLKGIPLVVTLAMETRDAIAPRLRTVLSFFGSGVVYVLTEVLGRGIGLVGRGIFQGMGAAWQDSKRRPPTVPDASTYQGPYAESPYTENPYSRDFNEWE